MVKSEEFERPESQRAPSAAGIAASNENLPTDHRLLVSRDRAREMLGGISVSNLRRLINAGEINPVFLNASSRPQRRGKLYFRRCDLAALVDKFAKRDAK